MCVRERASKKKSHGPVNFVCVTGWVYKGVRITLTSTLWNFHTDFVCASVSKKKKKKKKTEKRN